MYSMTRAWPPRGSTVRAAFGIERGHLDGLGDGREDVFCADHDERWGGDPRKVGPGVVYADGGRLGLEGLEGGGLRNGTRQLEGVEGRLMVGEGPRAHGPGHSEDGLGVLRGAAFPKRQ